jgi:hypothetical protein
MRARKSGNFAASRALLRALAAQQPDLPQVWLMLATVAETRAEQRHALQQVLTLDPRNAPAQRGLARMQAVEATSAAPAAAANKQHDLNIPLPSAHGSETANLPSAQMPTTSAPGPIAAPATFRPGEHAEENRAAPGLRAADVGPAQAAPDIRWPLYLVIGISILVVLIAAILIRGSEFTAALRPAPTAVLPGLAATDQVTAPALDTTIAPALDFTAAPAAAPSAAPHIGAATLPALGAVTPTAGLVQPTASTSSGRSTPPPTAVASPLPTPRETLAPGQVVEHGQWHAILIRPEDAVMLEGSIGSFQPSGRFVLALLAVGNDGQAPARLPNNLFTLVDGAGHRYTPLPQISTAYLNTYGRGQHGDLSMEDLIPSDGGNKSVPLIFDVPPGVHPLYLLIGDSPVGWLIVP